MKRRKRIYIDNDLLCSGVYLLYHQNEVVYVGQSKDVLSRINQHMRKIKREGRLEFKFDSYEVIPCEESKLNKIETELIIKYNPKYNKTISVSSLYNGYKKIGRVINANDLPKEINIPSFIVANTLILKLNEVNINLEGEIFNNNYECPYEYQFGKDWDKYEECEECELFTKCK